MADVLVVEDEDLTRSLLETRLRSAGHAVRAAASTAEALAAVEREGAPEVVVTDMFMPGGSGLGLVSALRADPRGTGLPVVFLSGRALPADVDAGRALGGAYLAKPFTATALLAAVEAAVASSAAGLEAGVRERLAAMGDLADPAERALFGRLLTSFAAQAPVAAAELATALGTGDAEAVEALAHRLAGTASTLGAAPLARLCADVEDRARSGVPPAREPVASLLAREVALTRRAVLAVAAGLDDGS